MEASKIQKIVERNTKSERCVLNIEYLDTRTAVLNLSQQEFEQETRMALAVKFLPNKMDAVPVDDLGGHSLASLQ